MSNVRRWSLVIFLTVLSITFAVAIVIGFSKLPTNTEQCLKGGGVVTKEYERKNNKWYTEYECMKDGREIDEWKVSGRR